MTMPTRPPRAAWLSIPITIALLTAAILVPAATATAAEPTDMVLEWNINAINAIQNANGATPPGLGQVPPLAPVNLAIVHAAIYDAVNAIDGTHKPYLLRLHAPPDASQAAAAATAAHHVLVGLVPTTLPQVTASLDGLYATSLGKITDGKAKSDGITVGAAAAAVMLADRLDDGRNGTRTFPSRHEAGRVAPRAADEQQRLLVGGRGPPLQPEEPGPDPDPCAAAAQEQEVRRRVQRGQDARRQDGIDPDPRSGSAWRTGSS